MAADFARKTGSRLCPSNFCGVTDNVEGCKGTKPLFCMGPVRREEGVTSAKEIPFRVAALPFPGIQSWCGATRLTQVAGDIKAMSRPL